MGRIRVLGTLERSRIAAGEVVENPASVVKELIENSLDAHASRIDIEIAAGGASKIRISDDGEGIYPEDVPLSVEHFATSKVSSADEVFGVETYGFRGEALASIAAVSRFSLVTRRRELEEGTLLRVLETGRKQAQPVGAPPGTTITVEDLFFSFPARKKFLKSERAEQAKLVDSVLKTALFRPDVTFVLKSGGKALLELPARKLWLERIADCLGNETANGLVPMEIEEGSTVRIHGFIGKPSLHRHNRSGIFGAVHTRPVESKELLSAVIVGYRGLLPEKRYPVAVLNVELPPAYVDVNVHPQKKEVRFRDPEVVGRLLRREISITLIGVKDDSKTETTGPAGDEKQHSESKPVNADAKPRADTEKRFDLWHGAMEIQTRIPETQGSGPKSSGSGTGISQHVENRLVTSQAPGEKTASISPADKSSRVEPAKPAGQSFLYIGQTSEGYMIVEAGRVLRIVDPHALHERMIYEELKKRGQGSEALRLLFPAVVSLSAREAGYKDLLIEVLAKIGFDVDDFGPKDISITAVPSAFEGGDPVLVAKDVLDALSSGGETDVNDAASAVIEKALASAACHAAVKLGKTFTPDEAVQFLQSATRSATVQVCPHGRPTSVDIDLNTVKGRLSR